MEGLVSVVAADRGAWYLHLLTAQKKKKKKKIWIP